MFNPLNLWNNKHSEDIDEKSLFFIKLFILNLKTIYSTIATKIMVIFSPIFVAFALAVIMPITYSIGAGQIFVTCLSAGTIWGMTYFSIRKSTLYDNLSIIRINIAGIYLTIFATIFFVTFLSQVTYWISVMIFDLVIPSSIIEIIEGEAGNAIIMNWLNVDWITIIYSWILSISIMFVICYSTKFFLDTDKKFFLTLITYLLIQIPFGGLVPPILEVNNNQVSYLAITNIQYVSLIFPQFHINSFNFAAILAGKILPESVPKSEVFGELTAFNWSTDSYWNTTILFPPIFLGFFGVLSISTIKT